ncbi:MAG: hypothetical protein ACRCZS_28055 [Chroococcidiopsis sp.]
MLVRGARECLASLRMAGYSFDNPQLISAKELGAMHDRKRVFIVSYANEWLKNAQLPRCWDDQMRTMVQADRSSSEWLSVERPSNGETNGASRGLVQSPLFVPTNSPGRIKARHLAGRCVCPAQARIPLNRVLHLDSLSRTANV